MEMLKKCLNPKVLIGLAVAILAIAVFAPNWLATTLPLLLLAACPLAMVAMMFMMNHRKSPTKDDTHTPNKRKES